MARRENLRIVLDTNWYISASINRRSRRTLYNILSNEEITIYYSTELLREYYSVISRHKFKKYINRDQADRFLSLIITQLQHVQIKSVVALSPDVDDNFLLSLCQDCVAEYLVTGDPHLLAIKEFKKTRIVTMAMFLDALNKVTP